MKINLRQGVILSIIPFLFVLSGTLFQPTKFSNDPDYIYLLNGLNLARGKVVGHVDNPGTPVMEISMVIISAYHALTNQDGLPLESAVLSEPDRFIKTIRYTFLLFTGFIMLLGGWFILRKTGNFIFALIFQFTPFASVNILEHAWTKVSPEPLLLMIVLVYSLYLLNIFLNEKEINRRQIIGLILFSGLGLATKATFLPLLIIPFFIIYGYKKKIIYVVGTIATFFLFTSPGHKEYSRMFSWFKGLTTHTGIYGKGDAGFIDPANYFASLAQILKVNYLWISILILLIATYLYVRYFKRSASRKQLRLILGIILAQLAGILLVAKHYHGNHYLLPVMTFSGISLIIAFTILKQQVIKLFANRILVIISLVLFTHFWAFSFPDLREKNFWYSYSNEKYENLENLVQTFYPNHKRMIHIPNSFDKRSALAFGNGYSKIRNIELLYKLYPDVLFFNSMDKSLYVWANPTDLQPALAKYGRDYILTGRPLLPSEESLLNSLGFEVVSSIGDVYHALYELKPRIEVDEIVPKKVINCSAENISLDQRYFITGSFFFSGAKARSNETSHYGNYSVKLSPETRFSLGHKIQINQPNASVKVSVWRKGSSEESYLIVASEEVGMFYKSQNQATYTDEYGWEKLEIEFTITDSIPLKTYVWNKGTDIIYFDDMEIRLH